MIRRGGRHPSPIRSGSRVAVAKMQAGADCLAPSNGGRLVPDCGTGYQEKSASAHFHLRGFARLLLEGMGASSPD